MAHPVSQSMGVILRDFLNVVLVNCTPESISSDFQTLDVVIKLRNTELFEFQVEW